MGRRGGLTSEKLEALADFETSDTFEEVEKLCLRYAVEMTKTPMTVPDELFEALRKRFTEIQLVELTSCIAWEQYRARFDHAFAIGSGGFSEGSFCPLPERAVPLATAQNE